MKSGELSHLSKKRQSICVFHKKRKKSNQNQNHKNWKKCHEHCTNFHCIALLHTKLAFPDKGCMHLHPENHVHVKCIDFSFRMRGPLKDSTSCFLIRLSFLVLVPISMFCRTQSPHFYLLQDSKFSLLSFIGLKVLPFIFHRTQIPLSLCFQRLHCHLSFTFHKLQCLQSFTLSKTRMSSVQYI